MHLSFLPSSTIMIPVSFPFPSLPIPPQFHIAYRPVSRRDSPPIVWRKPYYDSRDRLGNNVYPRSIVSRGPVPVTGVRTIPVAMIKKDVYPDVRNEVYIGSRYRNYRGRSLHRIRWWCSFLWACADLPATTTRIYRHPCSVCRYPLSVDPLPRNFNPLTGRSLFRGWRRHIRGPSRLC